MKSANLNGATFEPRIRNTQALQLRRWISTVFTVDCFVNYKHVCVSWAVRT